MVYTETTTREGGLGMDDKISVAEIRQAYKQACLRYHPDKHPAGPARQSAERTFKQINTVFQALLNNSAQRLSSSSFSSASSSSSSSSSALASDGSPPDSSACPDTPQKPPPCRHIALPVGLDQLITGAMKPVPLYSGQLIQVSIKRGARPGDSIQIPTTHNSIPTIVTLTLAHMTNNNPNHVAFSLSQCNIIGDDIVVVITDRHYQKLRKQMKPNDHQNNACIVPTFDGDSMIIRLPKQCSHLNYETQGHRATGSNESFVYSITGRGLPRRSDGRKRGTLVFLFCGIDNSPEHFSCSGNDDDWDRCKKKHVEEDDGDFDDDAVVAARSNVRLSECRRDRYSHASRSRSRRPSMWEQQRRHNSSYSSFFKRLFRFRSLRQSQFS